MAKLIIENQDFTHEELIAHGWKVTRDNFGLRKYSHPMHPGHVISTGEAGVNAWEHNFNGKRLASTAEVPDDVIRPIGTWLNHFHKTPSLQGK